MIIEESTPVDYEDDSDVLEPPTQRTPEPTPEPTIELDIDEILDKIFDQGMESLTTAEKAFLQRQSGN